MRDTFDMEKSVIQIIFSPRPCREEEEEEEDKSDFTISETTKTKTKNAEFSRENCG